MKKFNTFHADFNSEEKDKDGFNREDANRSGSYPTRSTFAKDKRKRISRTEKAVPLRKPDGQQPDQRRSYNPNFDQENRPRWEERDNDRPRPSYPRRDDSKDDRQGNYDKNRGDRPGGDRPRTFDKNRDNRTGGYDKNRGGGRPYKTDDRRGPAGKPFKPRRDSQGMTGGEYPKFPAPRFSEAIRLNRYIAAAGICSRREADENIRLGLVTVNGETVTEMGTKVEPGDIVRFNGSIVRSQKKIYIVMNKPKGFVTSLDDPHSDKTVMDLLKNVCEERVYPVGRLDKNSVGVLLITNDGDLTKKLTHPSYNKKKIYQVSLDKPLTKADLEAIAVGVELEDGFIRADAIDYVSESKRDVGIEIHSGRNRIVRRIFEHFGYKVQKLDRVYFAGLTKKNLKRGAWRFLTPKEVDILRSGMYE